MGSVPKKRELEFDSWPQGKARPGISQPWTGRVVVLLDGTDRRDIMLHCTMLLETGRSARRPARTGRQI
jgi:hypothetical protein